ncbi:hypothetical protein BDC45DRAFT_591332 [Circinella umbellata]|nr:hypothetical protein BDC45DRAFT_591332 [Circinella umbellata]
MSQYWVDSVAKMNCEERLIIFYQKELESLEHSFILDMTDDHFLKNNVFAQEEWNEMFNKNKKSNTPLPNELKQYMNALNVTSFSKLRKKLYHIDDWKKNYNHSIHGDFDWVHVTMLNL